jgi:hypothetical protein
MPIYKSPLYIPAGQYTNFLIISLDGSDEEPLGLSAAFIRTSQKLNIFYSKVFRKITIKTAVGGVEFELVERCRKSAKKVVGWRILPPKMPGWRDGVQWDSRCFRKEIKLWMKKLFGNLSIGHGHPAALTSGSKPGVCSTS